MKIIDYIEKNTFKVIFASVVAIVLILIWVFGIGVSTNFSGGYFNKNQNAIWIGHKWVGEPSTTSEIEEMLSELEENGFDTVYVHVGPLKSDGSIDPQTYRYSIDFVTQAKQLAPEMEFQAWLGQLRKKIDLSDPGVRNNAVNQAIIMTQMVGFDGIHYDIEPVWDGDLDFIKLLEETRAAIPEDRVISVALAEFIPGSVIWFVEPVREFQLYSTEVNFENVAQYADQIVVMTYDTSLDEPWLYRWLVQEQTIWVTSLFKDTDTEVYIALPAYDDETPAFDPKVENLENAIHGVVDGLNNLRSNEDNFAGIAVYPYWYIEDEEWEIFQELWLK